MKQSWVRRLEVELSELEAVLERVRAAVSPEDHEKLKAAVETLGVLTRELEAKGTSVARLRRILFGPRTETTRRVLGEPSGGDTQTTAPGPPEPTKQDREAVPKKRPGHGRNGVGAYRGAERHPVAHGSLEHGNRCPSCSRGKVYHQAKPASLLRITGVGPLRADLYELERLRCNLCGKVFTADAPEGVGEEKYDASAVAMISLLKYGAGLPFYRLAKLEKSLGIPLPPATQWELVHQAAGRLEPVYREHIRQAAQGEVLYNDDTTMRILELQKRPELEPEEGSRERTGVFTTGIVSTTEGRRIALFFTGRKHAGENLAEVLAQRAQESPPPIQMCDALSRNVPGEFQTILASCMTHARRQFIDVTGSFPAECRTVLETLSEVYRHDAVTRGQALSKDARLAYHQKHTDPLMEGLESWIREQIEERRVEPNSGLGEAIQYMQKHWSRLTLFLRRPGAPLDNTICERALKRAILHRKNALFYKTLTGARVGMTVIHTSELGGVDPFDYLVTLLRHHREAAQNPQDWMPWNYPKMKARPSTGPDPPD
ncbi:MAG: IS66 family transposase [Candidatus Eisenbacteria bacterium]|nr:IS66 family transposase [Candidatus Eisenbacteria bacterium]